MTTYYVLSEPCSNDIGEGCIVTEIWNPKPGQILAEFKVPERPFNPMTYLTTEEMNERQRLMDETKANAEKFLADWQSQK